MLNPLEFARNVGADDSCFGIWTLYMWFL